MQIIKFTEFIFHSAAAPDCGDQTVRLLRWTSWALALVVVGSGVSVIVSIRVGSQRAMFSEQQQKMPAETDKTELVGKQTVALEAEWSKANACVWLPLGH